MRRLNKLITKWHKKIKTIQLERYGAERTRVAIFDSPLAMTIMTAFFTFGSILIAGIGESFESEPNGLSFVDNILENFHESPTAFILFFIMFGVCVYGLCSCVYHHFLLWLRSDPNLERIQPIDGPNVSREEMVKDLHF
jgi:hypothetical protein